ncbi:NAD-glutamate dehydrogenase [Rhodomicrobium sp.]|uniref:NAD-glutamate dehydrogenase n=1 Tax=Rhodomicrobium sp. TaxID=2720632 RepID=UPI0039E5BC9C
MSQTADRTGAGSSILAGTRPLVADDLAARFAAQLVSESGCSDLASDRAATFSALAAEAFENLRRRHSHAPEISIRSLTSHEGENIVIDIANDDMPFLLDSVLGELRELGLVPFLVAHPIFEVERDGNGVLAALAPAAPEPNGRVRESVMHLEIARPGIAPSFETIDRALRRVIADTALVVGDFHAMTDRLKAAISDIERNPPPASPQTNAEGLDFLRWIAEDNFIFLGVREFAYDARVGELVPQTERSLGLLRDPDRIVLRVEPSRVLTPESRAYYLNAPPVVVIKANAKSTVHRRVHMDAIAVKLHDAERCVTGQIVFAGLFTASAFNLPVHDVPILRRTVKKVLRRSRHPAESHSGRALLNVLETFPREELFQISPERLSTVSEEILKTELAPRPRVLVRRDEFRRFVTVLVYVPREKHNTSVRERIEAMLAEAFDGRFEQTTPYYPESAMVRLQVEIWKADGDLLDPAERDLEAKVEDIITTWADRFSARVLAERGSDGQTLIEKYRDAFPAGYQERNDAERALKDIERFEKLTEGHRTGIDLYRAADAEPGAVRATLQQLDEPLTLSRRVPILENLGFDVISERTYLLTPKANGGARRFYLHDIDLRLREGDAATFCERRGALEDGFLAVWADAVPNDRFNGLILAAGLDWRQAALIRAYAAYYRQTGATYAAAYVAETLDKHGAIAADLFRLFEAMFDPAKGGDADREAARAEISARIFAALDAIPSMDDDRILRQLTSLIEATLRTNFYQKGPDGAPPETIAFKLRSRDIAWLPAPRPHAEIFVSSPRFEGVHLRGGPIARGGLRWSNRPQDFRTEILGLAKAQQVKNAVIVPQGAKGGFVPKATGGANRDATYDEGVAAYEGFVSSLLSLTDNLVKGEIVPPADTVRRDGDDPYLVVAADKGTATFSDFANEIAAKRGFWLGDAFASGGSAGYDHKKMGITAKGAWEAVKRHFREMNVDIQTTPFTVAGVGDMSGDVFGNGMLLSRKIRLVAAFDHRDIFIDPAPDPEASFEERKRLFERPRSSWQDYDRAKLSAGGGVYSRKEKSIALSEAAQKLLGVGAQATPQDVMAAILRADVDLLWFGGIGTYVRASTETDQQAGDKANDAIRAAANELRAKVIGEGANLGVTQKGRIEFALAGGRINTDAIDNSAGVNTSDVEVNIKIALGRAVAEGKIDTPERNAILSAMTDDVAASVLRNNYLQTLALSVAASDGLAELGFHQRLIQSLVKDGRLNRAVEALPTDAQLAERAAQGKPLTRPELAVLLAYAKIVLEDDLVKSMVLDDPFLARELPAYFPPAMRERFAAEIDAHPLRRAIIATSLANDIVNRGGPTFVVRLTDETGQPPEAVACAFAAVSAIYDLPAIHAGLDALDGRIDSAEQLRLYRTARDLLRRQAGFFLRHHRFRDGLEQGIAPYARGVAALAAAFSGDTAALLPERAVARLADAVARLQKTGLSPEFARRFAALEPLAQALDIVRVAGDMEAPVEDAARVVFAIRDAFHLDDIAAASEALAEGDHFDRLAVDASLSGLASAQRRLARSILAQSARRSDFAAWRARNEAAVSRVAEGLAEVLSGRGLTLAKLTVAVAQFRDLSAP